METGLLHKIFEYGAYLIAGLVGWFLKRHMESAAKHEEEQNQKLDMLDKRLDGHDVSRADIKAQISSIHNMLKKMDRNIDKLLERK